MRRLPMLWRQPHRWPLASKVKKKSVCGNWRATFRVAVAFTWATSSWMPHRFSTRFSSNIRSLALLFFTSFGNTLDSIQSEIEIEKKKKNSLARREIILEIFLFLISGTRQKKKIVVASKTNRFGIVELVNWESIVLELLKDFSWVSFSWRLRFYVSFYSSFSCQCHNSNDWDSFWAIRLIALYFSFHSSPWPSVLTGISITFVFHFHFLN